MLQDVEKKDAQKTVILGVLAFCAKYKLYNTSQSYVFLKIQPNTHTLKKARRKLGENWLSNNFFRIVSAKCSSDLEPCLNGLEVGVL